MSELVTGEAVVLGLQPAKLPSRIVAVAIDLAVYWGAYVVLAVVLVSATASLDEAAAAAVTVSTLLLLLVGLPVAVETLSRGRSLGKVILGLRVVRDDGGPIRFRHALVRGAVGAVEIQLTVGTIASIASLVSARGRRIGDLFAGTLVVRERVPAQYTRQPPPPPWVAAQVAGIDLSAVPEELWLAVRQYLSRMFQLDPRIGWSMAQRLAADVAARTGKAVPQGVPPAAYLAAVVAERQSRDAQRVFGNGHGNGYAAGYPGGPVYGAPGPGSAPGYGGGPALWPSPVPPPVAAPPSGWGPPPVPAAPPVPAPPVAPVTPAPGAPPPPVRPASDAPEAGSSGRSTGFAPPA
jgi:uncharacterized RDD family membrane protein YckC